VINLKAEKLSEQFDIALLQSQGIVRSIPSLSLSAVQAKPGDEVILLGYPTGLRALLARVGPDFIEKLSSKDEINSWELASELASEGLINPLASRGIVGQVSKDVIVYDAETAQGGSGGPVLTLDGKVIAVNTAILSEFGGSNMGIPIKYARDLFVD
jgi:S1-C subfamily serine protease